MLDPTNPLIESLLQQGYKVSVQAHLAKGRTPRYTAIARRADGQRAQGWGGSAPEALLDLDRRGHFGISELPGNDAAHKSSLPI